MSRLNNALAATLFLCAAQTQAGGLLDDMGATRGVLLPNLSQDLQPNTPTQSLEEALTAPPPPR